MWRDGVFSEEDANAGDLQGVGTTFPKTYSHLSAFNPLNPIGSFWAATSATLLKQSAAQLGASDPTPIADVDTLASVCLLFIGSEFSYSFRSSVHLQILLFCPPRLRRHNLLGRHTFLFWEPELKKMSVFRYEYSTCKTKWPETRL